MIGLVSAPTLPHRPRAWTWIAENGLQKDFATIVHARNLISVKELRNGLKYRDSCRWVLFVYGHKREERVVARSNISIPDILVRVDPDVKGGPDEGTEAVKPVGFHCEPNRHFQIIKHLDEDEVQRNEMESGNDPEKRLIQINMLPEDSESYFRSIKKPVVSGEDGVWWSEPPSSAQNMDIYARKATEFLRDLRSETPLGEVNRCGLWISLRAVAALGCVFDMCFCESRSISDAVLLKDILDRFHTALLYDLRQGAHRFSPHLVPVLSAIPASPPGVIASISPETPVVTRELRRVFPTDSNFGALSLEDFDIVAPLVASRAVFIQQGWFMAPLRLMRPYILAGRTVEALRRVSQGWLDAAAASTVGQGFNQPKLRQLGLQMKELFKRPLIRDIRIKASNVMYKSDSAASMQTLKPPRCVREYLLRAERGDPGAKLHFPTRWGMLRLLRSVGVPRYRAERAYLSTEGMQVWYPDPRVRQSEAKQRKATLLDVFRKPVSDHHIGCKTFARYGLCPFQGNVGACCVDHTGHYDPAAVVWSPMHVANLGRSRVVVEIERKAEAATDILQANLYVVRDLPARLHHASMSQL